MNIEIELLNNDSDNVFQKEPNETVLNETVPNDTVPNDTIAPSFDVFTITNLTASEE
jgi:hypothetical protein